MNGLNECGNECVKRMCGRIVSRMRNEYVMNGKCMCVLNAGMHVGIG